MKSELKIIFAFICALFSTVFAEQVTVLGINDMHGNIDELPRLSAFLKEERAGGKAVLLLSAGDNRTGNPYVDNAEQPGVPMIRLMNKLGFDGSTLGNHDFDSGLAGLQNMQEAAEFPFICANVQADAELNLKPYSLYEQNGIRIAVLGLVQISDNGIPDIHPHSARGLHFRNPYQTARDYAYLREQCDILLVLSHLGYEADCRLAEMLPQADAIIGGHTHTRIENGHCENGVLITQAENKVKYITRLTFEVENGKVLSKKAELIPLRHLPEDADMLAAVEQTKNNPSMRRQLTTVTKNITRRESLGCLMADALRAYAKTDIAIVNAGNVRLSEFPAGPFTVADCYRLDPFCNQTIVFKATGEELIHFLNAVPAADHHGAPYVSGMRYKAIKPTAMLQPMRITEATMADGTTITPGAIYTVATNSYLMSTVTPQPADKGTAYNMDGARALILYTEGKESVDYSTAGNIEITIE